MEQPADRDDDDAFASEPRPSDGDQERPAAASRFSWERPLSRPELPARRQPRPGFPWAVLLVMFLVGGSCILLALLSQGLLLPLGFVAAGIVLVCGFHYVVWGWWLGAVIRREEEEKDQT